VKVKVKVAESVVIVPLGPEVIVVLVTAAEPPLGRAKKANAMSTAKAPTSIVFLRIEDLIYSASKRQTFSPGRERNEPCSRCVT
jgi:hypothetical protein